MNNYQVQKYIKGYIISFAAWYVINALYLVIRYDALQFYSRFVDQHEYFLIHEELKVAMVANAIITLFLSWFSWNFYFFLDKRSKLKHWQRGLLILIVGTLEVSLLLHLGDFLGKKFYPDGLPYFNELSQQSFVIYFIYIFMGALVINSLFQLRDILGPELFQSVIQGQYYLPKEEDRIFMFLDLYNSTSIAECLGHLKYSNLIQDSYRIITDAIVKNKASVYQYVGDEIVLTWPTEKGLKENRCIHVFFEIEQALEEKRDYFMEKYGHVPEFKAGLHSGIVATAQVGVIKREVAYHGDTVNATARLQESCKQLGEKILISEVISSKLELPFIDMGEYQFRGKRKAMHVYTLHTTKNEASHVKEIKFISTDYPDQASSS
ncbi:MULTISPECIES: adenylate/guanylate cyclase domain-containing protein [Flammeovirga]|uniref:Adenylate/guanylate cyclase domain-containing protein n=1 Tax=Flammeovirga agarivorans TaxID=2726742 RepID=A0A7X8SK51_9BACT|nr:MULTISPECIES: adenylate/guanylate cyclase domain-containing protein [Flammeovirga]NLR91612.1 adenylate/guanylate cyclase domain-containing protein [Flammeovirga agarivorans]